jgi:hypothetical protein
MHILKAACLVLALSVFARAAELRFDFSARSTETAPEGFQSHASSGGKGGEWKVVWHEAESAFPPLLPEAVSVSKRPVLSQQQTNREGEELFFLVYEEETFGDFTLTTRIKIEPGSAMRAAGVIFHFRDPGNYYAAGMNASGSGFLFFKEVNGARGAPIEPRIEIQPGEWQELKIETRGNRLNFSINGRPALPEATDQSFNSGKIGFWTRGNTRAWFADSHIVYTPKEAFPDLLVREAMAKYPRMAGIRIYARPPGQDQVVIVASSDPGEKGLPASQMEEDVIETEVSYFSRLPQTAMVTLPLRDRNGEAVAAVQVVLKTFRGQTQANAVGRASPAVRLMEGQMRNRLGLFD